MNLLNVSDFGFARSAHGCDLRGDCQPALEVRRRFATRFSNLQDRPAFAAQILVAALFAFLPIISEMTLLLDLDRDMRAIESKVQSVPSDLMLMTGSQPDAAKKSQCVQFPPTSLPSVGIQHRGGHARPDRVVRGWIGDTHPAQIPAERSGSAVSDAAWHVATRMWTPRNSEALKDAAHGPVGQAVGSAYFFERGASLISPAQLGLVVLGHRSILHRGAA